MAMEWDTKTLADRAKVRQNFVRQEIQAGRLQARKIGGVWVIADEDAQRWLANPKRGTRSPRRKGGGT